MKDLSSYLVKYASLIIIGISFAFVCSIKPPYSSPDEPTHILRASTIVNGDLFLYQESLSGSSGAKVIHAFDRMAIIFSRMMHTDAPTVAKDNMQKMKDIDWDDFSYFHPMPNVGFYFPLIYAPHAFSIATGKLIGLTPYWTYILTNIFVFIICAAILCVSNRIMRIPLSVLVFLTCPMVAFQLMSPTIDGITISLSVMMMSIFYRSLRDDISSGLILTLYFCIFIVATSRANLSPLVLLPAWLFYKTKKKIYLNGFVVLLSACFAWVAYSILAIHDADPVRITTATNADIITFYLKNLPETLILIKNSIFNMVNMGSFFDGIFGYVAWQDAPVGRSFAIFFGVALVACIILSINIKDIARERYNLFFMLFVIVSIVCLTFLALLVQWSPFPTSTIYGVQGRYFIIPIILFAYSMSNHELKNGYHLVPVLFLWVLSSYLIHEALYYRFFV
ncbi:DUF2142 domain-containing protein [Escherichia coli]|nr:DUF2142 domain-containing protein [Escherichia coli]